MGGTKGYRSYRGRTSKGKIALAVLLVLIILAAVGFIGVVTFVLSAIGVKVGSVFGAKYQSRAELLGGVVLVAMGLKILLEHLGILQ